MAPYEALYDRRCHSPICWDEVGEWRILGPELIEKSVEAIDKIRMKIKIAQDRQKSYADKRRKELEFEVREKIFLMVASTKGVLQFGKKGKLKPRFITHSRSSKRKDIHDPSHIVNAHSLDVRSDITYE
ncbi:uncharacterized protein LOC111397889 [Olea europaea var. sylvestris]|uniref:uncharacterized protein LOC111397889 n=1 Tax=Olea europaea var. sylvestris TaxID=158386 RepID=UPI000C1D318E|nr:uncharacterized protein LOC111397889 [Olea europaea var. sylvestris]